MPRPFRLYTDPPAGRISGRPDPWSGEPADPSPVPRVRGPRGRSGRAHSERNIEEVRRLIEETALTYIQIEKRTGIARNNMSRWKIARGCKRPPFAPRATDTVPTARASAHLKRRMLGQRIHALAERHIRELEASTPVDQDKLAEALELLKMTWLAARSRLLWREGALKGQRMRPIAELCAIDVDLRRAPRAAVEDFLEHRVPPEKKPPRHRRGRGSRLDREYAWLREKERA